MLDHEVAVENDGFNLRQQRVFPVDVSPANLNHSDFGVTEVVDNVFQEVRLPE